MLALPLRTLQGHYSSPSVWPALSTIPIQPTTHCHSLDLTTQVLHPSFVTMPFGLLSLPHVVQLLFVAAYCTVCYLLPRAVQFALYMPCSLLLVATRHAVCYLLLHAVQFAICCCLFPHAVYSLLLRCMPCSLLFVAVCRAVCYLFPHAVQFATCCRMPCSLLFVAACRAVCYLLLRAVRAVASSLEVVRPGLKL